MKDALKYSLLLTLYSLLGYLIKKDQVFMKVGLLSAIPALIVYLMFR